MELDRFYCDDAGSVLRSFLHCSLDLICADPPYNLGKDYGRTVDKIAWSQYEEFTQAWLRAAVSVLKAGGSLYVFMGVRYIARLYTILDSMPELSFNGWLTWHY